MPAAAKKGERLEEELGEGKKQAGRLKKLQEKEE